MPAGALDGGGRWLLPSFIFEALHAAWQKAFPQVELWEHTHPLGRSGQYPNRNERSQRFGSLATVGPFPCVDGNRQASWQFPAPKDVVSVARQEIALLQLLRREAGSGNLPQPLHYVLGGSRMGTMNPGRPRPRPSSLVLEKGNEKPRTMDEDDGRGRPGAAQISGLSGSSALPSSRRAPAHGVKGWWSKQAIEDYLGGRAPGVGEMRESGDLFSLESSGGMTRRRQAGAASGDSAADEGVRAPGAILGARAPEDWRLRLADSVSLGFHAWMPLKDAGHAEGMDKLVPSAGLGWVMGRRQRAGRIERLGDDGMERWLPLSAPVEGTRVKWLLLTPAIFPRMEADPNRGIQAHPGGWLPNWVCPETGQVRLKKGDTGRFILSREQWRKKVRELPPLDCRLVAASVPPPRVVFDRSDQTREAARRGDGGWGWRPWQRSPRGHARLAASGPRCHSGRAATRGSAPR